MLLGPFGFIIGPIQIVVGSACFALIVRSLIRKKIYGGWKIVSVFSLIVCLMLIFGGISYLGLTQMLQTTSRP
mgnify:CR=1 FL=1